MENVKWPEQVQDRSKWKVIVEKAKFSQSCSAEEEEEEGYIYMPEDVLAKPETCCQGSKVLKLC
jgi:hypothetical protein